MNVLPIQQTNSPGLLDIRCGLWLALDEFASGFAANAAKEDTNARKVIDVDIEDVNNTLNGDGSAFERIVQRHQREIARRLRRFSNDPMVIEELVQETFVQAYFSLRGYKNEAPLIHWLHRIAVRAGYRHWKVQRSRGRSVALDMHRQAESQPDSGNADLLERILGRLTPRNRLVVTLLYLEGRSVRETAAITGWSATMVKVQAYRARAKLRLLMEADRAGGDE